MEIEVLRFIFGVLTGTILWDFIMMASKRKKHIEWGTCFGLTLFMTVCWLIFRMTKG